MLYTVTTRVQGFAGRRAGVDFVNGSVTLDDENPAHARAIAHFLRRDYTVEPHDVGDLVDDAIEAGDLEVVAPKRPAGSASAADWAAYALHLGYQPEEEGERPTKAEAQAFVRDIEGE